MPSSTTKAKPTKSTLLRRNAPSRPSGASMPPGERRRSPRQAIRPNPTMTTAKKKPMSSGPREDSEKAWTDLMTPERVRKVPRMVRANVAIESERFQTRIRPAALLDEDRVEVGRPAEPGQQRRVLHRVPAPEAAPAEHLVGPPGAEHDADGEEGERHQRPAPALDLPAVPHPARGQHADGEGEGHGEADESDVEERRVDRHQRVVLEERVGPEALGHAGRGDERVGRPDHEAEEERGDDVEDERGLADDRVVRLPAVAPHEDGRDDARG